MAADVVVEVSTSAETASISALVTLSASELSSSALVLSVLLSLDDAERTVGSTGVGGDGFTGRGREAVEDDADDSTAVVELATAAAAATLAFALRKRRAAA